MFDLRGEIALVTGAGGRLGPVWCKALTRAGATVHRMDLVLPRERNVSVWHQGDVSNAEDVARVLGWVQPTILVNNAGVDSRPTDTGAQDDTFRKMLAVNVYGTDLMTRVFGAEMAKRGYGSIINIASLYGLCAPDLRYYDHRSDGWVKDCIYGATKAGIISLTKYYAAKWAKDGVRVNALAPGGVVAEGDALTAQDPQFVEKYTARIPMGRMCRPEDLAGPLVFLASEASSFVTGHTIPIDGGFLCL